MPTKAHSSPTAPDPRFASRVLSVVRRIPPGRVATYGDVAGAAGRPRAWRAVGNIMRTCTARDVPCHRVIAAAGQLGGYGGNTAMKRALLQAEGVQVTGTRIRDFHERRWKARPLKRPAWMVNGRWQMEKLPPNHTPKNHVEHGDGETLRGGSQNPLADSRAPTRR